MIPNSLAQSWESFYEIQITADETVPDAITGDSHDIHNTDSIAAEGLYLDQVQYFPV